jgi:hypothetical protein
MGTSSSFKGPVGRTDLLPPWAPPLEAPPTPADPGQANPANPGQADAAQPILSTVQAVQGTVPVGMVPPPEVSWRGPKVAFSHFVSGHSDSPRSAFRSYVRAHGGAKRAAHSATSSRRSTAHLMGFLSDVARTGVAEAARRLGIRDLVGRDVQFVLASLVDLLAPAGSFLEEATARSALIDSLFDFCGRYDIEGAGLQALDAITVGDLGDALTLTVCNVVAERFRQELTSRVERGDVSESDGNRIFAEVGDFVREMVDLRLAGQDLLGLNWRGPEGAAFVEQVYTDAYSILENG